MKGGGEPLLPLLTVGRLLAVPAQAGGDIVQPAQEDEIRRGPVVFQVDETDVPAVGEDAASAVGTDGRRGGDTRERVGTRNDGLSRPGFPGAHLAFRITGDD